MGRLTGVDTSLGINVDYSGSNDSAMQALNEIANAGFSHIMWTEHWDSDYLYSQTEMQSIACRLDALGLSLADLHGTSGVKSCWYSTCEEERLAGVELIRNRVDMTAMLGGDSVILHPMITNHQQIDLWRSQGERSLRELEEYVLMKKVSLVLENLFQSDYLQQRDDTLQGFETIEYFFNRFAPDYLGFCWDTGHAFILGEKAFKWSVSLAHQRLRSIHLNDNQGVSDQHAPPLTWDSPWEIIAETIASSPYPRGKALVVEVDARENNFDSLAFLAEAHMKAKAFAALIARFT